MGMFLLLVLAFILPYIVGQAWVQLFRFQNRPRTMMQCYSYGIVALGAIFYVVSWIPLQQHMTLTALSKYCFVTAVAVGVLSLLIANKHLFDGIKATVEGWKNASRHDVVNACGMLLVLILAVLFARPCMEDMTPEVVATMIDTNSLYAYDAYTGEAFVDAAVNHNPIEAIYAVLATISGVDCTWMIHRILPLVLISAAMGAYSLIGRAFFTEKRKQAYYQTVVLVLMCMTLFYEHSLFLGILSNPWTGEAVLTMIVLPFAFYLAMECCSLNKSECTLYRLVLYVLSAMVGIIGAQLCFTKASVICAVLWMISIAVLIWRRRHA